MTDLPIYPSFHSATVKQGLSFEERARLASDAGYRATAFDVQGGLDFDRDHGPGAAKGSTEEPRPRTKRMGRSSIRVCLRRGLRERASSA